ncbi:hypothetical protein [Streptomyces atratus]|uniref:hypothetical protein n=1 Tax=Streptomyces atratus TaxID=1893 RepID=UPI0037969294
MIASTPVARWTWGRSDDTADELALCLRDVLAAYSVLAAHRLASSDPQVRVSVAESGKSNSYLFQGTLTATRTQSTAKNAEQLAETVRAALGAGEIGSVDAGIHCAGLLADETGEILQDGLFHLGASAFADFVAVDLMTFSDAWMPYDLKGRAQPGVYTANSARLAAALRELAVVLDSETDPEDRTYFGKPTETGVDNYYNDDGTASDVWGRFEVPYRNRVFRHAPGFDAEGYKRSTDGEVQYVPVRGEHGVLGYLWASDAENAASFEPLDAADEEGYKAGLLWLERLRSAYDRGLAPSEALRRLADLPDENGSGHVDATVAPDQTDLDSLRELAAGH